MTTTVLFNKIKWTEHGDTFYELYFTWSSAMQVGGLTTLNVVFKNDSSLRQNLLLHSVRKCKKIFRKNMHK